MKEIIADLLDLQPLYSLLQFDGPAYLCTVLIVFIVAKLIYDLLTPFKVNEQLTEVDNKAIAVSFSGYLIAVAIIILGIMSTEPAATEDMTTEPAATEDMTTEPAATATEDMAAELAATEDMSTEPAVAEKFTKTDFYRDLGATVVWGIIGILLLNLARIINDKLLLRKFDNTKELVTDKNIGTGAVLWGSYVGSAIIIRSAIMGEDSGFINGLISTLVYFVIGQLGFIIFAWIYQKITRYDLHAEIERDNISAGVAFGLSLTAIAILLSSYIIRYDSLPGFLVWFIISLFFIVVSRFIVDRYILPGSLLDEEISQDQNWGAALVEGGVAVGLALLLGPVFLD